MGYIEQNLMEGEQIITRAQLHYIVYWKPALMILAALLLFVFQISPEVYTYQGYLAAILLVIAFISILVIHGNRKYILTNRRLIEKVGIIRRESREILLRKCEGVQLSQSIMGRIFDYGTVVVSTTGEAENEYRYIQSPVRFQTLINQQIDHLRDDS
ncbi:MAG: PH domain-containing protein [Prevotella sp.]|jgi:uncharacterized membrane protein YdbT with pleckstrin-like domain|nr:PH domain-containing protein [Prevotella sp.]